MKKKEKKYRVIDLPVAKSGALVSSQPQKTLCMAKERRIAGAPSDLNVKYFSAGAIIGDPYITIQEVYRLKNI